MQPSPFSRPPQPPAPPMYVRSPGPLVEPSPKGPTGEARQALERQRRSGGQWFYWIAGLSLVNAAIGFAGGEWRFVLGLGTTQVVQEVAQAGSASMQAGLVGLTVVACFAILGQRAVLGHGWAFVLGMTLYALDGGVFLLIRDWAGAGFHAFALLMITRGYVASRRLSAPAA
ncbi:MAG TPA: hypothetical protein VIF11_10770 [Methylomirabilota bacterium]